jgi:hypothetical protein
MYTKENTMGLIGNEEVIRLDKEYRQSFNSIEKIVEIQNRILTSKCNRIVVDITQTSFISDALMILIASLPEFSKTGSKMISLRHTRNNEKMLKTLNNQGIFQYYKVDGMGKGKEDSISFCKLQSMQDSEKLVRKIMQLAPVEFSEKAYATIYSKLYEIFINAETHGKNAIGTFCNGTMNKNSNQFVFSIYDCGIGITQNVNNYLKEDLTPRKAIEWALTRGNSTLVSDFPRGAGFTLLEDFVNLNNGKMTLCSDSIVCKMQNGQRIYHDLKNSIKGTLFIMNITADREYIYNAK